MTPSYGRFLLTCLLALVLQVMRLPEAAAPFRPMLPLLVLAYWSAREPKLPVFSAALVLGVALDSVLDTPFGTHAIAMVPGLYLIHRFNALVTAMPLWQTTLILAPVWIVAALLLTALDQLAATSASPTLRLMPALATFVAWPVLVGLLDATARQPARR